MSSIVSGSAADCDKFPQNQPIAGWSEAESVVTLSPHEDVQFTAVKAEQEEEERIQHYTVTVDKNPESGSESEAFTPCGSLISENGGGNGSMVLGTVPAVKEIELRLENEELWQKFCRAGTEMIITKAGRYVRLLPWGKTTLVC